MVGWCAWIEAQLRAKSNDRAGETRLWARGAEIHREPGTRSLPDNRDGNLLALGCDMKIKVVELLSTITAAVATQDVDKLLELKAKLKAVDTYIQAPNVQAMGFIQLINVILRLFPDAPDLSRVSGHLEYVGIRPRVVAFDVGLVLFNIAEAVEKRDRTELRQVQVDLQSIEELIYGKLNEPPSAFVKLVDVLLPLFPDPEEEIEESEEPAESTEVIEEPDPTPPPQKRSIVDRLWKN